MNTPKTYQTTQMKRLGRLIAAKDKGLTEEMLTTLFGLDGLLAWDWLKNLSMEKAIEMELDSLKELAKEADKLDF